MMNPFTPALLASWSIFSSPPLLRESRTICKQSLMLQPFLSAIVFAPWIEGPSAIGLHGKENVRRLLDGRIAGSRDTSGRQLEGMVLIAATTNVAKDIEKMCKLMVQPQIGPHTAHGQGGLCGAFQLPIELRCETDSTTLEQAYEKSSPFSSMFSFTRKSRVVFHLSSLLIWSYWKSFALRSASLRNSLLANLNNEVTLFPSPISTSYNSARFCLSSCRILWLVFSVTLECFGEGVGSIIGLLQLIRLLEAEGVRGLNVELGCCLIFLCATAKEREARASAGSLFVGLKERMVLRHDCVKEEVIASTVSKSLLSD
ncbi:hypothetical protein KC363_g12 [Hortaea werneckii]|nr:hypothetical protein KC363_g12 [Hortaea werneckii]